MLPATTSNSPLRPATRATISMTRARMPVRGVDDQHVDAGIDQRLRALDRVGPDADRGADTQAALRVLRRLRELDALLDVLDGDQAA